MSEKITRKGEVLRKGYVKNSDGTVCRKTVLERYYNKGYLDLPNSCYSAEDRKRTGEQLAYDYYMGFPEHLKSIDVVCEYSYHGRKTKRGQYVLQRTLSESHANRTVRVLAGSSPSLY